MAWAYAALGAIALGGLFGFYRLVAGRAEAVAEADKARRQARDARSAAEATARSMAIRERTHETIESVDRDPLPRDLRGAAMAARKRLLLRRGWGDEHSQPSPPSSP